MSTLSTGGTAGEVIAGRYAIEERLGEGSMGTVYRARHVKVGRPFAVKVMHRRLLSNPKVARRFAREAELAGKLHHPNVIGVVDVGETDDGLSYLVMEYAPGYTLSALLEACMFTHERAVEIARQLCDGLQHAHEMGLVHRDFKPDNVLVDIDPNGRDRVRIVDFGIAILREPDGSPDQERLTTAGLVVGTPHYMSPEQAQGQPIDHRTDLFALGLIMYEMLTGRLPFDGSGVDIARANMLEPTPPMKVRAPGITVDPMLEAVVRKLLEKDADARPQSAAEVRELLDQLEHHRIAAARQLGIAATPSRRFPKATEAPVDTPPAAPADAPPESSTSVAAAPPRSETETPTTAAMPRARRRRDLAIAIAGALAIAVVLGLVLSQRSASSAAPIAARNEPPRIAPEPPATPAPAPSPTLDRAPAPSPTPVRITAPAVTPPRQSPNLPRETPRPRTPAPAPAPAETIASPAGRAGVPTPGELAALYGSVGRALKSLEAKRGEDAVFDLWPRYRWIRINEVLASPAQRADAARMLDELQTELRKREAAP